GPLPDVPAGTVNLTAVLQQGEAASTPLNSDRVIGSVRVPALLNELDYGLYSGFAISTDAAPGLDAADIPEPDVSWREGMRNLAYAIQWGAFAIFAVVMWGRMGRDTVNDRVTEHMSSDGNTPVAGRCEEQSAVLPDHGLYRRHAAGSTGVRLRAAKIHDKQRHGDS